MKQTWVIDVCRTCGCLATWPFCDHRQQVRDDEQSWCVAVVVTGTWPPK